MSLPVAGWRTMHAILLALALDRPLTVLHHPASDAKQIESLHRVSDHCMFKQSCANESICT